MKKIAVATTLGLAVVFLSAILSPTFAAAPTVVNDVWFVVPVFVSSSNPSLVPVSFTPDKVWASDDGTVLHSRSTTISTYVSRSPPGTPAGSVRIGSITGVSDFVFDTVTGTGTLNMKITISLTSTDPTKNPYGVGTLEGTLIAKVTSLNPYVSASVCPLPGDAQGQIVATHGTGAFENAKLVADVTMTPGTVTQSGLTLGIEYMFVGHHANHLYNEGTLTFHHPGPAQ